MTIMRAPCAADVPGDRAPQVSGTARRAARVAHAQSARLLVLIAALAAACGRGEPIGDPLFADPEWAERPESIIRVTHGMLGLDWQVDAGSVERISPTHLAITDLRLTRDGVAIAFDRIDVRGGTKAFKVSARTPGGGSIEVGVRAPGADVSVAVEIAGLSVGPDRAWQLGSPPLRGDLAGRIDLYVSGRVFREPSGSIHLTCAGCGTAAGRLYPSSRSRNPFMAEGVGIPAIDLGDLTATVGLDHGVAELELAQSGNADVTLAVKGTLSLIDRRIDLCSSVMLGEAAAAAHPELASLFTLVAPSRGRATALRTTGSLTSPLTRPTDRCD